MKVALVYDRVNKWGGAERVLLALHKIFPDAPLYTSLYDEKRAKWAKVFKINTSFLQSAKTLRQYNDLLALFMPVAFESFSFDEYDLVISVTSEAAKGIITKPGTVHICYCLTPTRYLWSGYEDYFSNKLLRFFSSGSVSYLRNWDKTASKRPDYYLAISKEVKKRIKKYYGKDSSIIFPPVMFTNKHKTKSKPKDYFLLVSRLSRFSYYKKVDLAIKALNKTGLPLKIVGVGPLMNNLKSKSEKNIEFLGELTDRELESYYQSCRALIFPGKEDFGLVMAEAISNGRPVIAYKAGGALDIVKEGINGEFFTRQNSKDLIDAIERFSRKSYNTREILRSSEKFSFENFQKELIRFLKIKKIEL